MWELPEAPIPVYETIVVDLIFLRGTMPVVHLPTEMVPQPGAV